LVIAKQDELTRAPLNLHRNRLRTRQAWGADKHQRGEDSTSWKFKRRFHDLAFSFSKII
jgi:hypothetical protein